MVNVCFNRILAAAPLPQQFAEPEGASKPVVTMVRQDAARAD
jgi:hypothetical protein